MKKYSAIMTFLFILTGSYIAQSKSMQLDTLFSYYNENGMFNGIVLVAENSRIVYNKGFGFSNFENKSSFDSSSVFAIGSITKSYTATAIMMLKEKNLLSYDDKISKYFTEFPEESFKITIRNLLTHTSGIPDFRSGKFGVFKLPLLTNEIAYNTIKDNFDLLFDPGSEYSYSNSNYFLLAMIIEKITGMSYPEFMKENIFKPLGMNNTYINYEFRDSIPNRINGYTYYWKKTDYDLTDKAIGHGNIYSTIYDQYLFDQALYSEKTR